MRVRQRVASTQGQTGSGEVTKGQTERGEIIPKSNSECRGYMWVRQGVARSHKVTLEVGRSRKVIQGVARSPVGQTGSGKVTENRTGW